MKPFNHYSSLELFPAFFMAGTAPNKFGAGAVLANLSLNSATDTLNEHEDLNAELKYVNYKPKTLNS